MCDFRARSKARFIDQHNAGPKLSIGFFSGWVGSAAVLEAPAIVAGLDDVAMVREPVEQGQIDDVEAIDDLLSEELSLRENRRIKAALRMARLPVIKTLAGYDFSFQSSLDRNRVLALAGLDFINRAEVVHLLGPPGTGKSHIATALAVEAVKAGKKAGRGAFGAYPGEYPVNSTSRAVGFPGPNA